MGRSRPVEGLEQHLVEFLECATRLNGESWAAYARENQFPSVSTVLKALGEGRNFSQLICELAVKSGPRDRVFVWPICPTGRRHMGQMFFTGSPVEYQSGICPACSQQQEYWNVRRGIEKERKIAWLATAPMFRDQYPDLVPYLFDPVDADGRTTFVAFRCSVCDKSHIPWSPGQGNGMPVCARCLITGGADPGILVLRQGGGDEVKFEADLVKALCALNFDARGDVGVVVPPDTYIISVVKPDVAIESIRVAIEIDNTAVNRHSWNRHVTKEGEADDRLRDAAMVGAGWRVLRVRLPDSPGDESWPWQVVTRSRAPKKLAEMIAEILRQDAGL